MKSLEEKLFRYVETPGPLDTPCWVWQDAQYSNGYGHLRLHERDLVAHREVWIYYNGPITPDELFVCHYCDVRPCINPAHLFLGTNSDNLTDALHKGRHPRAVLTIEDVSLIKYFLQRGWSCAELGRRYGVHRNAIIGIKQARSWQRVAAFEPKPYEPLPIPPEPKPKPTIDKPIIDWDEVLSDINFKSIPSGSSRPSWTGLTVAEVSLIKYFLHRGWSQAELSRRYDVAKSVISFIKTGRTWRHVGVFEPKPNEPVPVPPEPKPKTDLDELLSDFSLDLESEKPGIDWEEILSELT